MEFENTTLLAESASIVDITKKELKLNYNTPLTSSSSSSAPTSSDSLTMSTSTLSSSTTTLLPQQQQQQQPQENQQQQQQQQHEKPPNNLRKQPMSAAEKSATKKSLVILAGIFITSLAAVFYVYMIFPQLNEYYLFPVFFVMWEECLITLGSSGQSNNITNILYRILIKT